MSKSRCAAEAQGAVPRRQQCEKCPWKTGTDPHEIPDGYSVDLHRGLAGTIAEPGDLRGLAGGPQRLMACHESREPEQLPCVGWLIHQLGPGNNLGLRLAVSMGDIDGRIETVGPQHQRFEDTLPEASK